MQNYNMQELSQMIKGSFHDSMTLMVRRLDKYIDQAVKDEKLPFYFRNLCTYTYDFYIPNDTVPINEIIFAVYAYIKPAQTATEIRNHVPIDRNAPKVSESPVKAQLLWKIDPNQDTLDFWQAKTISKKDLLYAKPEQALKPVNATKETKTWTDEERQSLMDFNLAMSMFYHFSHDKDQRCFLICKRMFDQYFDKWNNR